MSESVHYRGILKPVGRLEGESLKEQCKRLLKNKELPSYYNSYKEYLTDEHYRELTIQNGIVYRVEKEMIETDDDFFNARIQDNGDVAFDVRYYNGGCSFDEAIERALKHID